MLSSQPSTHATGYVSTFRDVSGHSTYLDSLAVSSTECKAALGNFTHMLAIVSNLHPRFSRAKACDTADTVDTRFRCRRSERRVTQGSVSTVNTVTDVDAGELDEDRESDSTISSLEKEITRLNAENENLQQRLGVGIGLSREFFQPARMEHNSFIFTGD